MRRSLTFVYPGALDLNTGGYAYDRRVIEGLRAGGWTVELLGLGDGFPFPSVQTLAAAEERLSALEDDQLLLIDGLAYGVLDGWAQQHAQRMNIVALVHHPLALETGLDSSQQQIFRASETAALSAARHVIVTSPMTARELVRRYGVAEADITVAMPGTDKAPPAKGDGEPPKILSIGTLSPRKGHDVLIAALKANEDLAWQARIVGSRDLDPKTAAALEEQIEALGLSERIALAGECDDSRRELAKADIFALASRYEGYGMVFAEALSQGVPIVACHAGAVPDVVPEDAGFLVAVDDVAAFATALRRLLLSPDERRARARAAATAGALLPGWDDTAARIAQALDKIR
ncbi:glycosyl transferase group 1 [Rhizobium sp. PDO1-076]|uniref:glycosyltransferase family 4 protein n=1 Tax=Rhizobium sp. PDO1-076 TaxID=1125979 RepID=UPI00024E3D0D|nr:glycosyltransferase family 4 protein [Rhizobium sp. PDO1-076]EHS50037.1 glycosyl transferase group 1 [Rhizobium sp. PDO1-076]